MKKKYLPLCFFLLINIGSHAIDYCAKKITVNPNHGKLQKQIEKIETQLANNKIIAAKADKILSGLIGQKSPTITSWIKKRNLDPIKDDEKIIREWRHYFLTDFIFRAYPITEPDVDVLVEKHFDEINQIIFPKNTRKKFEKLFLEAQELSVKQIQNFPISTAVKNKLQEEIKKITLYWMNDFKTSKFSKFPMEFIDWGIAYDPSTNEINMGINANIYPNDETIIAVFAHEMAHAFDPCRFNKVFGGENPFTKIISCLRTTVDAKTRDDSQMDRLISKGILSKELASELKANPLCNKSNYPPIGFQKEQINEVFADWFSAEVVMNTPRVSSNLRTDLCQDSTLIEGSSYLNNSVRLNSIYLTHRVAKNIPTDSSNARRCIFN